MNTILNTKAEWINFLTSKRKNIGKCGEMSQNSESFDERVRQEQQEDANHINLDGTGAVVTRFLASYRFDDLLKIEEVT